MPPDRLSTPNPLLLVLLVLALSCGPKPAPPDPAPPAVDDKPAPAQDEPSARAAPPLPAPPPPPFRSDEVFRLAIRGGEVVDGSGGPRRRADVLVRGDRVAFVGEVDPSVKAERVFDATGAVVTPGFVDAHSHGNPAGDVEYALAQGVTTIVVGQDGQSPADDIAAWLAKIDASRPRVNVATLVGHASVRVKAGAQSPPRPADLDRMRALVDAAMLAGALGLSTGLEYDPGRAARMPELVAIAEPVGARGGIVMSHLRSEDDDKIDAALDELLEQCSKSGAHAHVAHLKIVLGRGVDRAERLLGKLAAARGRDGRPNMQVTADLYPYAASYTSLSILFPDFARPPSSYREALRSRRKELTAHLRARVEARNGPEATLFGTGEYAGKTLAEVARARGLPFEEVLAELGPTGAEAAYFVMDEAVVARLFADPFVMAGTDGGGGGRHPRGYGAFSRILEELVEKRHVVPLEEAVRKMSSLPARALGLPEDRGDLRAGTAADVLVFAPNEIHARADWTSPHRLAEGMRLVVVGGVIEREGGRPTSGRGGRALRFAGSPSTKSAP
jgi:N-acyl-D-amino-acid deacylase